ncbi:hypothetical protein RFX60_26360, partial [Acinetobacter sp. 11520]|nr:hypothetical protein [Acinetobacter sp. 11520]
KRPLAGLFLLFRIINLKQNVLINSPSISSFFDNHFVRYADIKIINRFLLKFIYIKSALKKIIYGSGYGENVMENFT